MKYLIPFLFLLLKALPSFSCTTFVLQTENELVFGRNLDWKSDDGLLLVNKRNVNKTALVFPPSKPMQWTSKYGSITFNQFGKEFPFGGMNEKGLVVEIMLADAQYPYNDARLAVNELQWVQYQLDNAQSIDEVISSDATLRISSIQKQLHFLVCDSTGNTAVIEFKNGKMIVYQGSDLPIKVLENDVYATSLKKNAQNQSCRFSRAADMIERFPSKQDTDVVDYSFNILDEVALSGSWSIVYDIKNKKIQFKTASNPNIQWLELKNFDFDCQKTSWVYDLKTSCKGNISDFIIMFTSQVNHEKTASAIQSNQVKLPQRVLTSFYNYHITCSCVAE